MSASLHHEPAGWQPVLLAIALAHALGLFALWVNAPAPAIPETPPALQVALLTEYRAPRNEPSPAPAPPAAIAPRTQTTPATTAPVVMPVDTPAAEPVTTPGQAIAESEPAATEGTAAENAAASTPAAAALVLPSVHPAWGTQPPTVYPSVSRRLREEGEVLLGLHVLADGRIGDVEIRRSSGHPRLDRAAVEAARRWRLLPARRGEEAVALWHEWAVAFRLQ